MEKTEAPERSDEDTENTRVFKALRFALTCIVLVLSYPTIRGSLLIGDFDRVRADMLEGAKLPFIASFVIKGRWIFLGVSGIVPLISIFMLRARSLVRSFYVIGVLYLIILVEVALLYQGLFAPLVTLLDQLGDASPH
jgi:hypothetical protein